MGGLRTTSCGLYLAWGPILINSNPNGPTFLATTKDFKINLWLAKYSGPPILVVTGLSGPTIISGNKRFSGPMAYCN